MAAPSTTIWGSIVNSGTNKAARFGVYTEVLNSSTTGVTVSAYIYVWTRYAVDDSSNSILFNWDSTYASTTVKSNMSVKTTNSEWSTSNQILLYSTSKSYSKGKGAATKYCAGIIRGLNFIGTEVAGYGYFSVPSLPAYTVTFNANGGSGAPSAQSKYYGDTLTLASTKPTKYGYTFMGWGTSATTTTVSYAAGGKYSANANITLYAIWKKDITLHYDDNGGNGSPSGSSATVYNATTSYQFTISTTTPTRVGYNFLGWGTSNADKTPTYQPGEKITLTATTVLYAVWELKTYTVSYDTNGGSNTPESQTKSYGVNITLSTLIPVRSGYKFLGWSTDKSATEPTYLSGGTFASNENTILYAVWERLGIAKVKISGQYKDGRVYVKSNDKWNMGIIFVKVDGEWRQGGI